MFCRETKSIFQNVTQLSLWALLLLSAATTSFAAYDFSYSGRLVDKEGKPLLGPVALKISFLHSESSTTSVLDVTTGIDNVTLKDGVFQVVLSLDGSDFHRVFPTVSQAVYIEVTDLTNAPAAPYGRQRLTILPYAGKVPVDTSQFAWSSDGRLQLAVSGGADSTAVATLSNKTIDATTNTITNISNASISATAAIADSKLATISTAGKVSGAAITSGTIGGSTAISTSGSVATSGKMAVGGAVGTSSLEVTGGGATSATSSLNIMNSTPSSLFYVRNDGYVGVGTTSPSSKFHIVPASTNSTGSSSTWGLYETLSVLPGVAWGQSFGHKLFRWQDSGSPLLARSAVTYSLGHGATSGTDMDVMTLRSDGNVGIGTTTPTSPLHVVGQASVGEIKYNAGSAFANAGNIALSRTLPASIGDYIEFMAIGEGATLEIQISEMGAGQTHIFRRYLYQNVYGENRDVVVPPTSEMWCKTCGAATLDWALEAKNTGAYATTLRIRKTVGTATPLMSIVVKYESYTAPTYPSGTGTSSISTTSFSSTTNIVSGDLVALNGKVGIGTTSPSTILHINNGSNFNPGTNVTGAIMLDGSYGAGLIFKDTGYSGIWTDTAGTKMHFKTGGTTGGLGGSTMTLWSNGNVGIGTTSPGAKLEVNGGVRLNTATAKPTCDAAQRGTTWVEQGGAGVTDKLLLCLKSAADTYSWIQVTTGG